MIRIIEIYEKKLNSIIFEISLNRIFLLNVVYSCYERGRNIIIVLR